MSMQLPGFKFGNSALRVLSDLSNRENNEGDPPEKNPEKRKRFKN